MLVYCCGSNMLIKLEVYGYDSLKDGKCVVMNGICGIAACDRDAKHSKVDRSDVG